MRVPFTSRDIPDIEVLQATHDVTNALSRIGKGYATVYDTDIQDVLTSENVACYLSTYAPAMMREMERLQAKVMVAGLQKALFDLGDEDEGGVGVRVAGLCDEDEGDEDSRS
jgi:hypothetical protein